MTRHDKRDEEAGGPGLGVLETRKRTRRAPDGSIVTRPSKRMIRAGVVDSGTSFSSNGQHQDSHGEHNMRGAPVSPPRSSNGSGSETSANATVETDQQYRRQYSAVSEPQNGAPLPMPDTVAPTMYTQDPLLFSTPTNWDLSGGLIDTDFFDDVFQPDTASSFNQPFTTMSNYNWLFDSSMKDVSAFYADPTFAANNVPYGAPVPSWANNSLGMPTELSAQNLAAIPAPNTYATAPLTPSTRQSELPPSHYSSDPGSPITTLKVPPIYQKEVAAPSATSAPRETELEWMGASVPMAEIDRKLPRICDKARNGVMDLITQARPSAMAGEDVEEQLQLLTLPALQDYCDLFFLRFNTAYPLLPQATFAPADIQPLFLVSVLLLGATYSNRDAHQMAVGVHDTLRPQIFSHPSFAAQPDLWVLQTILLVECFGKSRAGQKQHDMSHLFHGLLINLIRRSDCQSIRSRPVEALPQPEMLDSAWRTAMDAEQKKRLTLLCFMWDVQHAVLFSQSLCMSAFELRSSLPCDSATFEAGTAEEWVRCSRRERTHHSFLAVLKGYITPKVARRPQHLNALSRILLLHGLMSVSWDLNRRDQTSLGVGGPEAIGSWKDRMGQSYDLWKTDFDGDCMNMKLNLMYDLRKFTGLKTATHAIYHAAHIVLNVEVLDLQIYAGAPHILGRPVGTGDFERSKRAITQWLHEDKKGPARAAFHASQILRDAIMNLNDWDDNDVFHYPWCLYLATLSCWAFHLDYNGAPARTFNRAFDAKAEMTTLVIEMTNCNSPEELGRLAGKHETTGLASVMAKQLRNVRWAIVHDAQKVLNRLSEG